MALYLHFTTKRCQKNVLDRCNPSAIPLKHLRKLCPKPLHGPFSSCPDNLFYLVMLDKKGRKFKVVTEVKSQRECLGGREGGNRERRSCIDMENREAF